MIECLKIAFAIITGIIFIQFSVFVARYSTKWWVVAGTALLAYIYLLSTIFLGGKDVWLAKYVPGLVDQLFSSIPRATASVVVGTCIAILGAVFLYRTRTRGVLAVHVFRDRPNPNDSVAGVDVSIQDADVPINVGASRQTTNSDGIAEFGVRPRVTYLMWVDTMWNGVLQQGTLEPHTVEEVPDSMQIVLATDISNNNWVPAAAARRPAIRMVAPPQPLSTVEIGVTTKWEVGAQHHALWGLPRAPVLLHRRAYSLGYDPANKNPWWVAHRVHTGRVTIRRPLFRDDPDIPAESQAHNSDYTGSGYDRGSLVPFADIAELGLDATQEAFYLTVVVPQAPALNRGAWFRLEQYVRDAARSGRQVYVLSGPAFLTAQPSRERFLAIGANRVMVPTHLFMIVARETATEAVETLAFLIPNRNAAGHEDFSKYQVSVEGLQSATGLDFFSELDADDRNALALRPPGMLWPISK